MDFEFIDPILAAGDGGGEFTSAERSLEVQDQFRDKYGRWIEMGRGIKGKVRLGKNRGADAGRTARVVGKFLGAVEGGKFARVLVDKSDPYFGGKVVHVSYTNAEEILATLDPEYLKSRGIELGKNTEGFEVGDEGIQDEDTLVIEDATPEDEEKSKADIPDPGNYKQEASDRAEISVSGNDLTEGDIVYDQGSDQYGKITSLETLEDGTSRIAVQFQNGRRAVMDVPADRQIKAWIPKEDAPVEKAEVGPSPSRKSREAKAKREAYLRSMGLRSVKKVRKPKWFIPRGFTVVGAWDAYPEWQKELYFSAADQDQFVKLFWANMRASRKGTPLDDGRTDITEAEYATAAAIYRKLKSVDENYEQRIPTENVDLVNAPIVRPKKMLLAYRGVFIEVDNDQELDGNYLENLRNYLDSALNLGLKLPTKIIIAKQGTKTFTGDTLGFSESGYVEGEADIDEDGGLRLMLFNQLHNIEQENDIGFYDKNGKWTLIDPGGYINSLERTFFHEMGHLWNREKHGRQTNSETWQEFRKIFTNPIFRVSDYSDENFDERMAELFMAAMVAMHNGQGVGPNVAQFWKIAVLPFIDGDPSYWTDNAPRVNPPREKPGRKNSLSDNARYPKDVIPGDILYDKDGNLQGKVIRIQVDKNGNWHYWVPDTNYDPSKPFPQGLKEFIVHKEGIVYLKSTGVHFVPDNAPDFPEVIPKVLDDSNSSEIKVQDVKPGMVYDSPEGPAVVVNIIKQGVNSDPRKNRGAKERVVVYIDPKTGEVKHAVVPTGALVRVMSAPKDGSTEPATGGDSATDPNLQKIKDIIARAIDMGRVRVANEDQERRAAQIEKEASEILEEIKKLDIKDYPGLVDHLKKNIFDLSDGMYSNKTKEVLDEVREFLDPGYGKRQSEAFNRIKELLEERIEARDRFGEKTNLGEGLIEDILRPYLDDKAGLNYEELLDILDKNLKPGEITYTEKLEGISFRGNWAEVVEAVQDIIEGKSETTEEESAEETEATTTETTPATNPDQDEPVGNGTELARDKDTIHAVHPEPEFPANTDKKDIIESGFEREDEDPTGPSQSKKFGKGKKTTTLWYNKDFSKPGGRIKITYTRKEDGSLDEEYTEIQWIHWDGSLSGDGYGPGNAGLFKDDSEEKIFERDFKSAAEKLAERNKEYNDRELPGTFVPYHDKVKDSENTYALRAVKDPKTGKWVAKKSSKYDQEKKPPFGSVIFYENGKWISEIVDPDGNVVLRSEIDGDAASDADLLKILNTANLELAKKYRELNGVTATPRTSPAARPAGKIDGEHNFTIPSDMQKFVIRPENPLVYYAINAKESKDLFGDLDVGVADGLRFGVKISYIPGENHNQWVAQLMDENFSHDISRGISVPNRQVVVKGSIDDPEVWNEAVEAARKLLSDAIALKGGSNKPYTYEFRLLDSLDDLKVGDYPISNVDLPRLVQEEDPDSDRYLSLNGKIISISRDKNGNRTFKIEDKNGKVSTRTDKQLDYIGGAIRFSDDDPSIAKDTETESTTSPTGPIGEHNHPLPDDVQMFAVGVKNIYANYVINGEGFQHEADYPEVDVKDGLRFGAEIYYQEEIKPEDSYDKKGRPAGWRIHLLDKNWREDYARDRLIKDRNAVVPGDINDPEVWKKAVEEARRMVASAIAERGGENVPYTSEYIALESLDQIQSGDYLLYGGFYPPTIRWKGTKSEEISLNFYAQVVSVSKDKDGNRIFEIKQPNLAQGGYYDNVFLNDEEFSDRFSGIDGLARYSDENPNVKPSTEPVAETQVEEEEQLAEELTEEQRQANREAWEAVGQIYRDYLKAKRGKNMKREAKRLKQELSPFPIVGLHDTLSDYKEVLSNILSSTTDADLKKIVSKRISEILDAMKQLNIRVMEGVKEGGTKPTDAVDLNFDNLLEEINLEVSTTTEEVTGEEEEETTEEAVEETTEEPATEEEPAKNVIETAGGVLDFEGLSPMQLGKINKHLDSKVIWEGESMTYRELYKRFAIGKRRFQVRKDTDYVDGKPVYSWGPIEYRLYIDEQRGMIKVPKMIFDAFKPSSSDPSLNEDRTAEVIEAEWAKEEAEKAASSGTPATPAAPKGFGPTALNSGIAKKYPAMNIEKDWTIYGPDGTALGMVVKKETAGSVSKITVRDLQGKETTYNYNNLVKIFALSPKDKKDIEKAEKAKPEEKAKEEATTTTTTTTTTDDSDVPSALEKLFVEIAGAREIKDTSTGGRGDFGPTSTPQSIAQEGMFQVNQLIIGRGDDIEDFYSYVKSEIESVGGDLSKLNVYQLVRDYAALKLKEKETPDKISREDGFRLFKAVKEVYDFLFRMGGTSDPKKNANDKVNQLAKILNPEDIDDFIRYVDAVNKNVTSIMFNKEYLKNFNDYLDKYTPGQGVAKNPIHRSMDGREIKDGDILNVIDKYGDVRQIRFGIIRKRSNKPLTDKADTYEIGYAIEVEENGSAWIVNINDSREVYEVRRSSHAGPAAAPAEPKKTEEDTSKPESPASKSYNNDIDNDLGVFAGVLDEFIAKFEANPSASKEAYKAVSKELYNELKKLNSLYSSSPTSGSDLERIRETYDAKMDSLLRIQSEKLKEFGPSPSKKTVAGSIDKIQEEIVEDAERRGLIPRRTRNMFSGIEAIKGADLKAATARRLLEYMPGVKLSSLLEAAYDITAADYTAFNKKNHFRMRNVFIEVEVDGSMTIAMNGYNANNPRANSMNSSQFYAAFNSDLSDLKEGRTILVSPDNGESLSSLTITRELLAAIGPINDIVKFMAEEFGYKVYSSFVEQDVEDVKAIFISALVRSWAVSSNNENLQTHALQRLASQMFAMNPKTTADWDFTKNKDREYMAQQIFGIKPPKPVRSTDNPRPTDEELREYIAASDEYLDRIAEVTVDDIQEWYDDKIDKEIEDNREVYTAFIRAQYQLTQDLLRDKSIDSMALYRGTSVLELRDSNGNDLDITPKDNDIIAAYALQRPLSSWSTDIEIAYRFGQDADQPNFGRTDIYPIVMATIVPAERILCFPGNGFGCYEESEVIVLGGAPTLVDFALAEENSRSAISDLPGVAKQRDLARQIVQSVDPSTGHTVETIDEGSASDIGPSQSKKSNKNLPQINVDSTDDNANWVKKIGWDLPTDMKDFLEGFETREQLADFMAQPAAQGMPIEMQRELMPAADKYFENKARSVIRSVFFAPELFDPSDPTVDHSSFYNIDYTKAPDGSDLAWDELNLINYLNDDVAKSILSGDLNEILKAKNFRLEKYLGLFAEPNAYSNTTVRTIGDSVEGSFDEKSFVKKFTNPVTLKDFSRYVNYYTDKYGRRYAIVNDIEDRADSLPPESYTYTFDVSDMDENEVSTKILDPDEFAIDRIGYLGVSQDGNDTSIKTIDYIGTNFSYRRRGIATAMLYTARQYSKDTPIYHSEDLSEFGFAFSNSVDANNGLHLSEESIEWQGDDKNYSRGPSQSRKTPIETVARAYKNFLDTKHPNLEYEPFDEDNQMGIGPDNDIIGLVRPEALKKIQGNLAAEPTTVDSIEEDYRSGEGLYEPVRVGYNPKTGYAAVLEGNHRVQAAINAGEEFIPTVLAVWDISGRKIGEFTPGKVEKTPGKPFKPSGNSKEINPYFVFPDSDIYIPEEDGPSQSKKKLAEPFDPQDPNLDLEALFGAEDYTKMPDGTPLDKYGLAQMEYHQARIDDLIKNGDREAGNKAVGGLTLATALYARRKDYREIIAKPNLNSSTTTDSVKDQIRLSGALETRTKNGITFEMSKDTFTDKYGREYFIITTIQSNGHINVTAYDKKQPRITALALGKSTIAANGYIQNYNMNEIPVAYMSAVPFSEYDPSNVGISYISTKEEYQRRGIASAMLAIGRWRSENDIKHSEILTKFGFAFANSTDRGAVDLHTDEDSIKLQKEAGASDNTDGPSQSKKRPEGLAEFKAILDIQSELLDKNPPIYRLAGQKNDIDLNYNPRLLNASEGEMRPMGQAGYELKAITAKSIGENLRSTPKDILNALNYALKMSFELQTRLRSLDNDEIATKAFNTRKENLTRNSYLIFVDRENDEGYEEFYVAPIYEVVDSLDEYDEKLYEDEDGNLNYEDLLDDYEGNSGKKAIFFDNPEDVEIFKEYAASILVSQWAQTSNGDDVISHSLQTAARDLFKMYDGLWAEWDYKARRSPRDLEENANYHYGMHSSVLKDFLKTMYDLTQDALKNAGVKYLTVYRGTGLEEEAVSLDSGEYMIGVGDVEVVQRPMSAWSWAKNEAIAFAADSKLVDRPSMFMGTIVPAEQVLSFPGTGFGSFDEAEVVLLAGTRRKVRAVTTDKNDTVVDQAKFLDRNEASIVQYLLEELPENEEAFNNLIQFNRSTSESTGPSQSKKLPKVSVDSNENNSDWTKSASQSKKEPPSLKEIHNYFITALLSAASDQKTRRLSGIGPTWAPVDIRDDSLTAEEAKEIYTWYMSYVADGNKNTPPLSQKSMEYVSDHIMPLVNQVRSSAIVLPIRDMYIDIDSKVTVEVDRFAMNPALREGKSNYNTQHRAATAEGVSRFINKLSDMLSRVTIKFPKADLKVRITHPEVEDFFKPTANPDGSYKYTLAGMDYPNMYLFGPMVSVEDDPIVENLVDNPRADTTDMDRVIAHELGHILGQQDIIDFKDQQIIDTVTRFMRDYPLTDYADSDIEEYISEAYAGMMLSEDGIGKHKEVADFINYHIDLYNQKNTSTGPSPSKKKQIVDTARNLAATGIGFDPGSNKTKQPNLKTGGGRRISIPGKTDTAIAPTDDNTRIKNNIIALGHLVLDDAILDAEANLREAQLLPEGVSGDAHRKQLEKDASDLKRRIKAGDSELENLARNIIDNGFNNLGGGEQEEIYQMLRVDDDRENVYMSSADRQKFAAEETLNMARLEYNDLIENLTQTYIGVTRMGVNSTFQFDVGVIQKFRSRNPNTNRISSKIETRNLLFDIRKLAKNSGTMLDALTEYAIMLGRIDTSSVKEKAAELKDLRDQLREIQARKTNLINKYHELIGSNVISRMKDVGIEFDSVKASELFSQNRDSDWRSGTDPLYNKPLKENLQKTLDFIPKNIILAGIAHLAATKGKLAVYKSTARAHFFEVYGGGFFRGDTPDDFHHEVWHFFQFINPDITTIEHAFSYDRVKTDENTLKGMFKMYENYRGRTEDDVSFSGADVVNPYMVKQYPGWALQDSIFNPSNQYAEVATLAQNDLFTRPGAYSTPKGVTVQTGTGKNATLFSDAHIDIATGIWYTDETMTDMIDSKKITSIQGLDRQKDTDWDLKAFGVGLLLALAVPPTDPSSKPEQGEQD